MNVDSRPHSLPENPRPCDAWKEETKVQRKFPPHPNSLWGNPGPVPGSKTSGLRSERNTQPHQRAQTTGAAAASTSPNRIGGGGDEKQPLRATRHRRERPCSASNSMGTSILANHVFPCRAIEPPPRDSVTERFLCVARRGEAEAKTSWASRGLPCMTIVRNKPQ